MSSWFAKKSQTYKVKKEKKVGEDGTSETVKRYAETTLGSGNLRLAVTLPEGEDINEWLAANTVDFFNQVSIMYSILGEFCTAESCPIMSAGPRYEYHWADGETIKKPIRVSASEYVDFLMIWVQRKLEDERVFPSKIGSPFPRNFQAEVKQVFRRMFRVYAHIYHSHFQVVVDLGMEAHLNTSFRHFIYFINEFQLVEKKELAPLSELIDKLCS